MAFTAFARPRPPLPPLPELAPLLSRFDFDGPFRQGTNAALVDTEDGQLIESWSGYALIRSGPMLRPFVVPAVEGGRAKVATESGAARLWFKPYWSSASLPNGTGPGVEATLAEMFVLDENEVLTAWTLRFTTDGTALILSGETDGGQTELLRADVAWPADEWHCLALNYGPKETALFLDGFLVAKGAGVASVPVSAAGLTWGSTAYGTGAAEGEMDELCAFARPLRELDLAFHALAYSTVAARGPISAQEDQAMAELRAKRKAEREAEDSEGDLQMLRLVGSTAQCFTNVPVRFTNIVSTFVTNQGWTVTFDIQGGTNGLLYDVFTTTNLSGNSITNSQWPS